MEQKELFFRDSYKHYAHAKPGIENQLVDLLLLILQYSLVKVKRKPETIQDLNSLCTSDQVSTPTCRPTWLTSTLNHGEL